MTSPARWVSLSLVLSLASCTDAHPLDAPDGGALDDAAVSMDDAAVSTPDAFVAQPDAWSMGSCPGYASDVQPLYARHCASCHTTGRDARFGSNVSVARSSTSACGTSMAACTIQLGQRGGNMSFNDPLGGFTAAEVQTIQSWIDCGEPN